MARASDEAIERTEVELESLKGKLEELRRRFVQAAGKFIAEWFVMFARDCVQRQADHSLILGPERLGELKAKVMALADTAGSIAEEIFADRHLWWHLSGDDTLLYLYCDDNPPENIDGSLRRALGRLGPLLKEYGYVTTGLESGANRPENSEPPGEGDTPPSGQPYFRDFQAWPQNLREPIGQYRGLLEQAKRTLQELHRLRREQKQTAVADLWDSV